MSEKKDTRFSSTNQPEKYKGKQKPRKKRGTILTALLDATISTEHLSLGHLVEQYPQLFEGKTEVTGEELMYIRMVIEATFGKKPLPYMIRIEDSRYGKLSTESKEEGEVVPIDPIKRASVLAENLQNALAAKKLRDEQI